MTDVLVATSRDTPLELVTPLVAALGARGLAVKSVDLGRVSQTGGRLGRVVQALLGEVEAGRMVRELAEDRPRAAVAFDPGALAALVLARDRRVSPTPVVAVVPDLAPGRRWAIDADRFLVLDDEAAVALSDHGVDGARVLVIGPLVPHGLHEAAGRSRAELRRELSIPLEAPVVVLDTRGLSLEALSQITLQLSLLARPVYTLFDAAGDADAAAQLRRQVPSLGLKGKLFGESPNAPRLWRAADIVMARPTARAIHAARLLGALFVALEQEGEAQLAEARALEARGLGATADKILFLPSALEPLVGKRGGPTLADGAGEGAEAIAGVVAHHEEVLAETFAAAAEARASATAETGPASDVEELGGDEPGFGGVGFGAPPPSPRDQARRERLKRELDESRLEAERWDERRRLAQKKGDRALAEQAAREADRKRARMHEALQELQRLASADAHAAAAPPEDPLAALRRQAAARRDVKTLDDELADLKSRMKKGPR
jgi:UDP-N-acetylglucosamine:LPS N-acetylglucosamine transferase